MIADADEINENDIDSNNLLHDLYENGQDSDLTRLTEMVRQHYLNYLEKQLKQNLLNSNFKDKHDYVIDEENDDYHEMYKKSIKKTAEILEDKAVKACMIGKFYQRAMIKIIAVVRRTTQEKRLITHLEKCINGKDEPQTSTKETQTDNTLLEVDLNVNESINQYSLIEIKDKNHIISLDKKIEMFQKHLQKEKYNEIVKKFPQNKKYNTSKRQYNQHHPLEHHSSRRQHRQGDKQHIKHKCYFSPASSVVIASVTPPTPISPATTKQTTLETTMGEGNISNVANSENSNDSVAAELARLFSEEKTELDEIFGIDPNAEPDDPHICKILKEIKDATIDHTKLTTVEVPSIQNHTENPQLELSRNFLEPKQQHSFQDVDLSKSIWPCELFMQRRKLSESLAYLIEEDLRWHDVMKWKFSQLFGEDSDDEFTPCSPSIELNEILIGSCIRRISPWVVKHLMKPMKDGLIGNRFLFKKLAKNLARSIIMENQYPDESTIKDCIENFFCLHQAVMSVEDLDVYMPNVSYF